MVLMTLSKTARMAVEHYMEDFDVIHLVAALLSPQTKKMLNFEDSEIEQVRYTVPPLFLGN